MHIYFKNSLIKLDWFGLFAITLTANIIRIILS
jgi:hypothetical protein